MRFFSFHLMPYTQLSPAYDGPAWVTCPNELYDPQVGHQPAHVHSLPGAKA